MAYWHPKRLCRRVKVARLSENIGAGAKWSEWSEIVRNPLWINSYNKIFEKMLNFVKKFMKSWENLTITKGTRAGMGCPSP